MTDEVAAPAGATTRWQYGTVVDIHPETASAKTFTIRLEQPPTYLAGQHYVLRLTAPDGYTAARSYSVASAPDGSTDIALTVERLPGGEVSMFLHDEVVVGDELELRGPIGGWFVWHAEAPALLIGGGSGVVPLMSMLRLARNRSHSPGVRLVVSVRRPEDLYYAAELRGPDTTVVFTRQNSPATVRRPARLNAGDLGDLAIADLGVFICGSSPFVAAASNLVLERGVEAGQIRLERFGPSG